MGTDCAPFLANLYLFVLEYKWIARMEEGRKKEPEEEVAEQAEVQEELMIIEEDEEQKEGELEKHETPAFLEFMESLKRELQEEKEKKKRKKEEEDERNRRKKEEEGWTEEEKEQRLKDIKMMKFVKRYIDDGLTVNGIY